MFKESGPRSEPAPSKSLYETLGVSTKASEKEIKAAFKAAAFKTHPDRPGGDESKFKAVNEAYQTLSDSARRKVYDAKLFADRSRMEARGEAGHERPKTPKPDPQEIARAARERREHLDNLRKKDEVYRQSEMAKIYARLGIKKETPVSPSPSEAWREKLYESLPPEHARRARETDEFVKGLVNQKPPRFDASGRLDFSPMTAKAERPATTNTSVQTHAETGPRLSAEDLSALRQEAARVTTRIRSEYQAGVGISRGQETSPISTAFSNRTEAPFAAPPPVRPPASPVPGPSIGPRRR